MISVSNKFDLYFETEKGCYYFMDTRPKKICFDSFTSHSNVLVCVIINLLEIIKHVELHKREDPL